VGSPLHSWSVLGLRLMGYDVRLCSLLYSNRACLVMDSEFAASTEHRAPSTE
jgi:hypothetical protein